MREITLALEHRTIIQTFFTCMRLLLLQGQVKDIIFKGNEEEMSSCTLANGKIPMVSNCKV